MNERQKRFADEYIISGNIEQSAIKAGYSKNYARGRSHELLANVGIKRYIEEHMEKIKTEKIADQQEIMEFLTSVLRNEETERIPIVGKDYFELVDNTPSIKDRTKAAELLGKRYVMWTDKTEHAGNVELVFEDDYGEEES